MPEVVVTESRKADLKKVASKRDTACVLVAESEGRVIGTVTLLPPNDPGSRAWTPQTADLRYLAVDPAFHGKGVGEKFLEALKENALKWKVNGICLHIRKGADGLARFYSKHGYIRTPEGDINLLPEIFLHAFHMKL